MTDNEQHIPMWQKITNNSVSLIGLRNHVEHLEKRIRELEQALNLMQPLEDEDNDL